MEKIDKDWIALEAIHVMVTWFSVDIEPEKNVPIVYVSANKKVGTFKEIRSNWGWYVDKWAIKYWTYASNLTDTLIL